MKLLYLAVWTSTQENEKLFWRCGLALKNISISLEVYIRSKEYYGPVHLEEFGGIWTNLEGFVRGKHCSE